jgi:hypothetical protein
MNVSAVNNQKGSSERPWEERNVQTEIDEVQVPFLNSANTQVCNNCMFFT